MEKLISYGPTVIVCLPVIITFLIYQIHFRLKSNKWKAIHFSVQYSVLFYMIADVILLEWIFAKNFLGIILIVLIALLSIILIMQRKNKTEVILLEGLIVLSRLCFLFFSFIYVGLLLYVVISGYLA